MKFFKQFLKEDNEAIKVRTQSGSWGPEKSSISISDTGKAYTVRLDRMPTEIVIQLQDGDDLFGRFAELMTPELSEKLQLLRKKDEKKFEEINKQVFSIVGKEEKSELQDEFHAEMDELIDHLTTFLKARIIAHVNDTVKNAKAAAKAHAKEIHKLLDDALKE